MMVHVSPNSVNFFAVIILVMGYSSIYNQSNFVSFNFNRSHTVVLHFVVIPGSCSLAPYGTLSTSMDSTFAASKSSLVRPPSEPEE